jgi:hypothetical protein
MSKDEDIARWVSAAHAMQSGVVMEQQYHSEPTDAKHLRVGVNSALSDAGGLVKLLIAKGIFTEEEYLSAIADAMEREQARYEKDLSYMLGKSIKLA